MIKKILNYYKKNGAAGLMNKINREIFKVTAKSFENSKALLIGKKGLEIGGPSSIFKKGNLLPVYNIVKSLDNCNFSQETIWEGRIDKDNLFQYEEGKFYQQQFIGDSTELSSIPLENYDFILSSHVIEHLANPLKGLSEWRRILKEDGYLLIIIPHKDGTFDHRREITPLEHIIEDYENNIQEDDLTHLEEILKFHDLSMDPGAGSFEQFKKRSEENFKFRGLHQHVFSTLSACQLLDYAGFKILNVEVLLPFHIIVLARKVTNFDNTKILSDLKQKRYKSPFVTDSL